MDVHHHTHTPRKKWTHYFWEFLMLFLAVFCGFLAENQREHIVEKKRGRQFMQMLLEDLKLDTIELNRIARASLRTSKYIDTALNNIYQDKLTGNNVLELYRVINECLRPVRTDLQEGTSTQLKNAGNLRLIHTRRIKDSLANYWYLSDILQNTNQLGYEADRKLAKDLTYGLISYDNYNERDPVLGIKDLKNLQFINDDFGSRVKLGNYFNNMRRQLSGAGTFSFKWTQMRMKQSAANLIELIKEEYHFD